MEKVESGIGTESGNENQESQANTFSCKNRIMSYIERDWLLSIHYVNEDDERNKNDNINKNR